jgi:uncharacterized metal-binding protein YceD (DUF177 family)
MRDFVIQFSGLKEGIHSYKFDIGRAFFEHFSYGEISNGAVKVDCEMDKQDRMLLFNFRIKGLIDLPCDRCNEPLELKIEGDRNIIVKFGLEEMEEDDEIYVIPESAYEFDVSHILYEFIHLMLPGKRVHGEDKNGKPLCNPDILKMLEDQQEEEKTDPRWDALKKLKDKK